MSHGQGDGAMKVVIAALAGNLAIAACKFGAAYFSKSAAMLAEAVHSLSDTGNQALLLVGMRLALRPASEQHPFGRSGEQYFWPFIVSLLLFAVGGAFAIYEGIHKMHEPGLPATTAQLAIAYVVLGVSVVFEAFSFSVAFKEFRAMRRGRSYREVLTEAKDVTVPLVLMEDTAALAGLSVALVGVFVAQVTHAPWIDGAASVVIGAILCAVAVFLAFETHGLLIGEAATREDRERAERIVSGAPRVRSVVELLTLHIGPNDVILALKVAFDTDITLAELEEAINEIERRVRGQMPHMRRIFVEPDSLGGFTEGVTDAGLVTESAGQV
ncbi:MAG: cation diffusion facilitator family transporter [Deltaproteobacteria bacterium]|nr:cation diffusion facilitator family transporter [Deltaproteobacteria bacterium]